MPERRSIAVFPYRPEGPVFLLLKRVPAKGGGWQPVTGRVDTTDAPPAPGPAADVVARCERLPGAAHLPDRDRLLATALRELEEETGLTDVRALVDLGTETTFTGYDDATYAERAFAAAVPADAAVTLSAEHEDARWVGLDEALGLLTWDENRAALRALAAWLTRGRKK